MILKMKLVNMVGIKSEIDKVIEDYLLNQEIEFENPLTIFKNIHGFTLHKEANPYEDSMKRFREVFDYAGISYDKIKRHKGDFSPLKLDSFINRFDKQIHSLKNRLNDLKIEREHNLHIIESLEPILEADVHLDSLSKLKYLKFRFGHLPKESFEKLDIYLSKMPAYFTPVKTDKNSVWGIYFAAEENIKEIDHIFTTLYFERIWIETGYSGTPMDISRNLKEKCAQIDKEYNDINSRMKKILSIQKNDLLLAYACLKYYYDINMLKKFAAYTENSFYLTFWADEKTAKEIAENTEHIESIKIIIEEPDAVSHTTVPTKLKNNYLCRPFEDFVKMYGVPMYNEIDPTPLLAFFYTLFFGMMFGDFGHGIVLFIIGIILTVLKKGGFIGKILIPIGISSVIFGLLYGVCFGFEGHMAIIRPLWFTPMEHKTRILLITVGIGVGVILLCMIFNIVNGIRQKNWHKALFSQNGIAGILFYTLSLYTGLSIVLKSKNPPVAIITIIIISLALIFLKEPLSDILEKRRTHLSKEKSSFFIQSFFELFEILLSFITNSMSFVRVGAFALNHAGMMSVVIMFMEQMNTAGLVITAILGNALVIGLEGLIVGIQVLRLGFYEMFSRFYEGGGRLFKPQNY